MSVERPPMHKQRSLNTSNDPSVYVSPMQLERRNTVTLPRSESRSFKDLPQTSPLKRFAQAKESISRVFMRIHEQLQEVMSFLASVPGVAHKASLTVLCNNELLLCFQSSNSQMRCEGWWNVQMVSKVCLHVTT